jgi:importin-9
MVKGDLIIPESDRILTRSRSRQNPDQFTIIPAPFKIIKVLVEELLSASGAARALDSAAIADLPEEGSDEGDWEDDDEALDLGLGSTKQGTIFCRHWSIPDHVAFTDQQ